MTLATTAGTQLTADLKPQLKALVDDMRARLDEDAERAAQWRATYQRAVREERTAGSWTDYVEDQLTQAAVGWLLTSVFVRFCEDNLLLGDTAVWISGPTEMLRQRARDAEDQFYREDSDRSYREWLEEPFAALRANPGTRSLLDDHAAIDIIEPSSYAVEQLLAFWRRTDDDGALVWRFDDPDLSTRFLGDLYQDLSDYAKKKYALLQTPEFVEEFILDQTMEPALKDRPLEGFKIIDPTCGSGHFLLGAFERLAQRWAEEAPGMESRARVNKALGSVHGVDINPFAVAIAKFRLIVAALKAAGDKNLVNVPQFEMNLAAGDSLLFGPESGGAEALDYGDDQFDADAVASGFAHSTEDRAKLTTLLTERQYDAVVGNPPYITVKDKALNARYRQRYRYCKGTYALTVPFMERFFALAKTGGRPGWVGQITSNSFMKREFGVPVVEEFLATRDLRLIVDTSGAYIPGHGTPTVILVGRDQDASGLTRAILGIQGEPGAPADPAKGMVWSSIVEHVDQAGYEDRWLSVTDLPREFLSEHPWSLSGGGAVELLAAIDSSSVSTLCDQIEAPIGRSIRAGADEGFMRPRNVPRFRDIPELRGLLLGEEVRDWRSDSQHLIYYPYVYGSTDLAVTAPPRELWFLRRLLQERRTFQGNMADSGLQWWAYMQHTSSAYRTPLSITFAFVATHNHFVLDRGGKVFNRSAPVIKLPEGASEEAHLRLLGVLNSSTACFWLKQNSHNKGSTVDAKGARTTLSEWENFFEFTGTTLKDFPLPSTLTSQRPRRIDDIATALVDCEPPALLIGSNVLNSKVLDTGALDHMQLQGSMISEQENLDWEVYQLYGLIDEDLNLADYAETPGINLGERAFEIALARRMAAGEVETEWFNRHGSTPITEIPSHWPEDYQALVQRRLDAIENNAYIRLLERPEYKRRWAGESWGVKVQRALRDWLLDKLENPQLWVNQQGMAQPRSIGEISGVVSRDPEFIEALDLWAGHKDAPVTKSLEKLLSDQSVPYLAALRYKESGLRKRAEWESVWELQRAEDRGEVKATDIDVPPKYTTADFRKTSYWSHRGKLDVPKERFILYPDAGRDTDPTPLLGWAGWNHAEQSLALAAIISDRESEGAAKEKLIPLVAGVSELLPWVKQWHSGSDPNLGVDFALYFDEQLQGWSRSVGVPVSELHLWRPPAATRGRKKKAGA